MSEKATWRAKGTPVHIKDELQFIKDFKLGTEQLIYRYKVSGSGEDLVSLNDFCKYMGLRPIDGESEPRKARRLLEAICAEEAPKGFVNRLKLGEEDPQPNTVKGRQRAIDKLQKRVRELRDINFLDENSNPPKEK